MTAVTVDFNFPDLSNVQHEELAKALSCRPLFMRRITQIDGNIDFFELTMLDRHLSKRINLTPEQGVQLRIIRYILENKNAFVETTTGALPLQNVLLGAGKNRAPVLPTDATKPPQPASVQKVSQQNNVQIQQNRNAQQVKKDPKLTTPGQTPVPAASKVVTQKASSPPAQKPATQDKAGQKTVAHSSGVQSQPKQKPQSQRQTQPPVQNQSVPKSNPNSITQKPVAQKSSISLSQEATKQPLTASASPAAPLPSTVPSVPAPQFSGIVSALRTHASTLPANQNRIEMSPPTAAPAAPAPPPVHVPSHSLVGPPPAATTAENGQPKMSHEQLLLQAKANLSRRGISDPTQAELFLECAALVPGGTRQAAPMRM